MSAPAQSPSFLARHGLNLILLFAFSIVSLLVVQQQQTIESQRSIIRQLFQDSLDLSQMRMHTAASARRQPPSR